MPNNNHVFVWIIGLIVLVGIILIFINRDSYLDRDPIVPVEEEWTEGNDSTGTVSFSYPNDFDTEYITPVDWPPVLTLSNEVFGCTETSASTGNMSFTEERSVSGREMCVTETMEGAAGSVYTDYSYTFRQNASTTGTFTFSTRMSQCANYGEAERMECDKEREEFSLDELISDIIGTIMLENATSTN